MSTVAEAREIVSALRAGLVPRRGLSYFATGLEPLAKAVAEELDFVATGKGTSKVGSSRVDLQACKLEYSIVSPK